MPLRALQSFLEGTPSFRISTVGGLGELDLLVCVPLAERFRNSYRKEGKGVGRLMGVIGVKSEE